VDKHNGSHEPFPLEGTAQPENGNDHVGKTIDDVVKLESPGTTVAERISERVAIFTGSLLFVWLHVAWFAVWLGVNFSGFGFRPFDPFPYTLLRMIVSPEAIFLSAFILIIRESAGSPCRPEGKGQFAG
jgi:uncharacterized membrane protein